MPNTSLKKNMLSIFTILLLTSMPKSFTEATIYPTNSISRAMTCEEFGKSARFNPYSVLNDIWFVFYFWGGNYARKEYEFFFPSVKERDYINQKLENVTIPVNWTARNVIMKDINRKISMLLVEKDQGQFWMYSFQYPPKKGRYEPEDVRLKQVASNTFIGFMLCDKHEVYAMSRTTQIPKKFKIQDAAATIGYKGRGGLSYLYQGHRWMPIPEATEEEYWTPAHVHEKRIKEFEKLATNHQHKDEPSTTTEKSPFYPDDKKMGIV